MVLLRRGGGLLISPRKENTGPTDYLGLKFSGWNIEVGRL